MVCVVWCCCVWCVGCVCWYAFAIGAYVVAALCIELARVWVGSYSIVAVAGEPNRLSIGIEWRRGEALRAADSRLAVIEFHSSLSPSSPLRGVHQRLVVCESVRDSLEQNQEKEAERQLEREIRPQQTNKQNEPTQRRSRKTAPKTQTERECRSIAAVSSCLVCFFPLFDVFDVFVCLTLFWRFLGKAKSNQKLESISTPIIVSKEGPTVRQCHAMPCHAIPLCSLSCE